MPGDPARRHRTVVVSHPAPTVPTMTNTGTGATWLPVTTLPADTTRVLPRLLAAGAREVQINVQPVPKHTGFPDYDPLLSSEPPEVRVTVQALWPDNHPQTLDDALRVVL